MLTYPNRDTPELVYHLKSRLIRYIITHEYRLPLRKRRLCQEVQYRGTLVNASRHELVHHVARQNPMFVVAFDGQLFQKPATNFGVFGRQTIMQPGT